MKNTLLLSIFLLLIVSCNFSNPNSTNVNETMLIIENYTDETLYLTIEDGSVGPYTENVLLPNETISQTWESDDAVFVLYDGQVLLRYHAGDNIEETALVQLSVGYTSYYTISSENSVLVIHNDTNAAAWYTIDSSDPGYLFPGETDGISFGDLSFATPIDLFYTGYHVFSNTTEITIYPYNTQDFEIQANAGAIKLENNSLSDIVEVYIAPEENAYWGENQLYSILEPEESTFWTIDPGWWDIRLIDEWGASFDFLHNYISLDDTDVITFRSSSKNTGDQVPAYKQSGTGNILTEYRIELKK